MHSLAVFYLDSILKVLIQFTYCASFFAWIIPSDPFQLTSASVPNPPTCRTDAVLLTTLIETMDYSTLAGALASAVTAFEAARDEVEVVKPPETSLTVQPTVQSPPTEPSLTMESIFTLPPPESANQQSPFSTGKREKRFISFRNKKKLPFPVESHVPASRPRKARAQDGAHRSTPR